MAAAQEIIVVGGGLAGLMATIRIAELGAKARLFSMVSVKRSHSVCAQGGINGAVNTKGEGDSPLIHFDDTIYGGDFLANQPPVKAMTAAAPRIIYLLDRMGVMFNRTAEGLLDFRRFGGTRHHRTAFAGATTGQQLLYALDEQVRRHEVSGLVEKHEHWEFLSTIVDDEGRARGIVAQHLTSMEVRAFPADAVILATGGPGRLFGGRSTNSMINTGYAVTSLYLQGAAYGNGEFIQIHPTAIPGEDKLRLMSESARGEGGRCWVPRKKGDVRPPRQIPDAERWYFLEEKDPVYGNLLPRDIVSREIHKICFEMGMGIGGRARVYLDLTHLPKELLDRKLGGILEIYEKFCGVDPRVEPMQIFPAVHYSMGGLWVAYETKSDGEMDLKHPRTQMTSIEGAYAVGECDYQYHGANRLGANSLLSCIFAGDLAGPAAVAYGKGRKERADALPPELAKREIAAQSAVLADIAAQKGGENPYKLLDELGEMMTAHCTIVRHNDALRKTLDRLDELEGRVARASCPDGSSWTNQSIRFVHQLRHLIALGKIVAAGALARDESRGAHYKPEFEKRDDENWLKTTIATYDPKTRAPRLSYEAVDTRFIKPRPRVYGQGGEADAPMTETIKLSVKRQDRPDAAPYWQDFQIPKRPSMNVISCLMEIQRNPAKADGGAATPVAWDCSCLEEVCGICTMVINGRVRQACSALVDQLEQPIRLEPMRKFPVVRDLCVDRSRMFESLKRVKAWIPIDGTHDLGPGPRMNEADRSEAYHLSQCMTCGCCLDACPQINDKSAFIGAAAIGQVVLFNSHPTGAMNANERTDALMEKGGIIDCGNAQNCVRVCPKDIPLTWAIAKASRATTIRTFTRIFDL